MRKNMLTLCLALAMALSASVVLADTTVQDYPCVKPDPADAAAVSKYESCMAALTERDRNALESSRSAIDKAEAAMEQPQPEPGSAGAGK